MMTKIIEMTMMIMMMMMGIVMNIMSPESIRNSFTSFGDELILRRMFTSSKATSPFTTMR